MISPGSSQAVPRRAADVIRDHLSRYVGPFTAKNAVQLHAKKTFGVDADVLSPAQVLPLLEALGPLLRTLLGKQNAERVIEQVKQELAL